MMIGSLKLGFLRNLNNKSIEEGEDEDNERYVYELEGAMYGLEQYSKNTSVLSPFC